MSSYTPQDNRAYRFLVSVKGVVILDDRVVVLQNEREEWELPGGKLEHGEQPTACVIREIEEELGLITEIGPILDSWAYRIAEGVDVVIVTYGCHAPASGRVQHSPEHKALGMFSRDEIADLRMPEGYKRSIRRWFERVHDRP